MSKKSVIVVCTLATVGLVGAVVFARKGTSPTPGSVAAGPSDPVNNRAVDMKLAMLQAQVSSLQGQLADRTPPPAAGQAAALPKAEDHRTTAEQRADDARKWHEMIQKKEADFRAEPKDQNWARETTSEFQTAVQEMAALRTAVKSVDCRSSTCRVEMETAATPAFQKQVHDLVIKVGKTLPSMTSERTENPDGTRTEVFFWSKDS